MMGTGESYERSLEVITIELICETCGHSNPPGTEFCTNCNSYLAWDRSVLTEPTGQPSEATRTTPKTQAQPPMSQSTAQLPAAGASAPNLEQPVYKDISCPNCGTINQGIRRFCSHCGNQFFYSDPNVYAGYDHWSAESQAAQERAAWKAYRRSLPALYRWRRVIIVLLLLPLGLTAGLALGRDPVGSAKDGWYWLRREYDPNPVTVVRVTAVPRAATAAKTHPAALVDGSENEWTINWAPSGRTRGCGPTPGTGVAVLTLERPTRTRLLQIAPGLAEGNKQRELQLLPKGLAIAFDNGLCQTVSLTRQPIQNEIPLDSRTAVTQVTIGIASVYPSPNAKPLVSITELAFRSYPS
jgi:Double zinc ribbon